MRFHALGVGVHLSGPDDRRWRQDASAGWQIERMADAAGVHQLHEYFSTLGVHGLGYTGPAIDLGRRENSRDTGITEPIRRRRGTFRDNQTGGRALRVILRHERIGNIVDGATSSQRRHDQMIFQFKGTERSWGEQFRDEFINGHLVSPFLRSCIQGLLKGFWFGGALDRELINSIIATHDYSGHTCVCH